MVSDNDSPGTKQKSAQSSGSAGKYLANVLYLVTILFVLGFIWQSIASFMLP
jgi:hypothetical protein